MDDELSRRDVDDNLISGSVVNPAVAAQELRLDDHYHIECNACRVSASVPGVTDEWRDFSNSRDSDMPSQQVQHPWHAQTTAEVLEALNSSHDGLSQEEAAARLEQHGLNRLPQQGVTPLWRIILRQFLSPLIYILVAAAIVSVFIGELQDAGFIAAVLVVNAAIGSYQEWQAERSSQALRQMLNFCARVTRDGKIREIAAEHVVPGDIVWLESGNRVPGDMRILAAQGLAVDESMLTGESAAVVKDDTWQGAVTTPVADRMNMTLAGSMVMRGRSRGLVVATGLQTNIGQLAQDVAAVSGGQPPLLERMERFTNFVAIGTLVVSLIIGVLAVLVSHLSLLETFFLVVALAVSAIPEGLPVAMTVALSVAAIRMAKRNVIVRRLTAIEGLGSCTLIATDKTGTLTCNEMTVCEMRLANSAIVQITGEGFVPHGEVSLDPRHQDESSRQLLESAVRAGVLCNEADLHPQEDGQWVSRGDAVDVSLLCLGHKLGQTRKHLLETYPQVNQIPYEPEHQFAASFHRDGDATVVYVKGSPERVLAMCGNRLSAAQRDELDELTGDLARRGLRLLALATGHVSVHLDPAEAPPQPAQLTFLGFAGLIDPLRPGAKAAIQQCREAGVGVAMITGDHRDTATAIARDLGLVDSDDQVMTGPEVEQLSAAERSRCIDTVRVFARVTPRQKLEIVEAFRNAGHYVAVTGDGVNDAPALRAANIGVAMGRMGTDVAREAADLVVSDDNFASIVAGIDEGRIAYDNIRKVIFLLTSMGAAELVMVLLAVATGVPVPLLPVQLLWLNLVTDGMQGVAMAFEPGEGDTLRRRPRSPSELIFDRLMTERMLVAVGVVGIGGFLTYYGSLWLGWPVADARNLLLLVMVLFENFHVANCRSETKSAFAMSPFRSPVLLFGTLAALLIHVAGMHIPFVQSVLSTSAVSWQVWGIALLIAVSIVPAMELHKWFWAQRTHSPDPTDKVT